MFLTFLSASVPLTKTYSKLPDGSIEKSSYPNVWEVTSINEACPDLQTMEKLLIKHAALGHCLLKGSVARPLVAESRKGSTDRNATTEWLCLDIDGIEPVMPRVDGNGVEHDPVEVTVDYIMNALGLGNVSYILQWSGSQNIGSNALRCHIFIMLTKAVSAPLIKQWLIQKNHEVPLFNQHLSLTKTGNALSWGLDITACQSDKLIYIAPPTLKGIKNPLGRMPRISLVTKAQPTFLLEGRINSTDQNRSLTDTKVLELRDQAGLPKRKLTYKTVGAHEVLAKPGECIATEIKQDRGFTYFNLNGGDSWAYYHPEDNPDYIFNFKGEPTYLTKELLPAYWESLSQQAYRVSSTGLTYLAFLERRSSIYWRGTYDAEHDNLQLYSAKNENMVRQFADANGLRLGSNIPEWDMVFDPHQNVRVDFDNRTINTFQTTEYMRAPQPKRRITQCPPTVFKIISHILCGDLEAIEHFQNWMACIVQQRDRTRTAWVFQGVPGCLAGDTQLLFNRGTRAGGRVNTIKQAYELWSGTYSRNGKGWDPEIVTRTKSVVAPNAIGFHEILNIMEAGVKPLYKLTSSTGRVIRVSELHPFMRPDGSFTPLNKLKVGDAIVCESVLRGGTLPVKRKRQPRRTTYSLPYHPFAWQHMINGKNYGRMHTARLVVEADMNNMPVETLIHILRTDPVQALTLKYLSMEDVVHHIDENPMNDELSNLTVIDKENHDRYHGNTTTIGMSNTQIESIASIEPDGEEMTYDITMKAPHQNYVANGFVVHNTGKGLLFNRILKPLFGESQTVIKRAAELSEKWTDYAEGKLIVFIDEIQSSALKDEAGVIANLKTLIVEPSATVRVMNRNAYSVPNYTNWLFASNKPDPIQIDKNDRRFNVGPYQQNEFPRPTDEELDVIADELQDYYWYLEAYPLDKLAASTPLASDARNTLIELSQTTSESTSSALQEGNLQYFLDQMPTGNNWKLNLANAQRIEEYRKVIYDIMVRTRSNGGCNIRRDELFVIFNYAVGGMSPSPTTFTKFLGHRQITIRPVSIEGKTERGITITWAEPEKIPALIASYFPEHKGVKT